MCVDKDDGFISGGEVREGFVKPLGQAWKKVTYAEVDGRAVFEGCIILGSADEMRESAETLQEHIDENPRLLTSAAAEARGVAIKGKQFRWPKRTIPYSIDADVPNPQRVLDGIKHWHERTTIRFKPRNGEKDYMRVKRVTSGCASQVGRRGGEQELVLADNCSLGNIIHELGHCIGLWHEQSRADRNTFVEIVLSNIIQPARHNFDQHILDGEDLNAYDYGSIMHYPPMAPSFAVDPSKPVIRPRSPLPPGVVMGQRTALSPGDIAAVEKMYASEPLPA